ncbi:MAG: T9SS type A sorting domain-containing protein [Ignavibacteria bacterium]|nr:T9SS type A sorting domain-containing protein [Ignavibacteria bacterium]
MKNIILKKRIISIILFLVVCSGFFIISFGFRDTSKTQPQSGGWQLQTNLQTMLNGRVIKDMTFLDSLTGFAVTSNLTPGDSGYIFKTTNGGNNWFVNFMPSKYFSNIKFINDSIGYACGGSGGGTAYYCKTTNRGINWTGNVCGWAALFSGISVINKDTIYLADDNALVGGVFRSTDGGGNWQRIYNGGMYNPQDIYMINGRTGFYSQENTYKTTDGGFSWTIMDNVGFRYMKFFDTLNGYRITSSTYNVQKTTNCGINWTTQVLPDVPGGYMTKQFLRLCFVGTDTIWAAGGLVQYPNPLRTWGVLYKTTNSGLNWGYQIPDTSYQIPEYDFVNFVGKKIGWAYDMLGVGIFTTVGGDSTILVGINQTGNTIPEQFTLEQNYPNPFNSMTNVKFQIVNSGNVKIKVFDVQGREIAVLVNEKLQSGTYQVRFDGSNLSSGVYFYTMFVNEKRIDGRKMLLIK